MSKAVHIVERELHIPIHEDYPFLKFLNQLEMIRWYREQEQKEYDRSKLGR